MWCGLFTEMLSRPAKKKNGDPDYELWESSYAWSMLPHALGVIPYGTAWAIIINSYQEQLDELCQGIRDAMPAFVPYVIFGCFAIFSTFTFVQLWCCSALNRKTRA